MACFSLLSTFAFSSAADIYITPDGSSQGVCTTSPHNPSWFNSSGNWGSGSSQIGAGTVVHLCGKFTGSSGAQFLVVQGSGASGNPITVKFEAGTSLKAPYVSAEGAILMSGRSYITIDGGSDGLIQNTSNGSAGGSCPAGTCSTHQDSVGIQAYNCSNCEIRNLSITDLYDHTSFNDAAAGTDGLACVQFSGSNFFIHDNKFRDVGWCLYQNYTNDSGVRIYNNDISRMSHGITCAGASFIQDNLQIFNNHLHDMANWNTSGNDYHLTGIHCYNGSGGKIQNVYIYNNLFDGSLGTCCITGWIFMEGTSSGTPWTDSTGTVFLWNNIFSTDLDIPNGLVYIGSGRAHEVLNNTWNGPNAGGGGVCLQFNTSATSVTIENNVIQGCNQLVNGVSGSTFSVIDYNVYGSASGGNAVWQFGGMNSSSFSSWKSTCNCDSHSQASISGPLKNISPSGVPSSGFMGIGTASSLANVASGSMSSLLMDTGAGGTHIPVTRTLPWDAGAYKSGSGVALMPPSGLQALVQ